MNTRRLLAHVHQLTARVNATLELGIKGRVLRSGLEVTIHSPHLPGTPGPVQHYPKKVTLRDYPTGAAIKVKKTSGREASIDLLSSPERLQGSVRSSMGLRRVGSAMLAHLKKNKITASYAAHPMSTNPNAVQSVEKLDKRYRGFAKRAGLKVDDSGYLTRLRP